MKTSYHPFWDQSLQQSQVLHNYPDKDIQTSVFRYSFYHAYHTVYYKMFEHAEF